MDPIVVRISGLVSASVGNTHIVIPGADYYAEESPAASGDTRQDGFEESDVVRLPVWTLKAIEPQRVPDEAREFALTDEAFSQHVVAGEITILEDMCP